MLIQQVASSTLAVTEILRDCQSVVRPWKLGGRAELRGSHSQAAPHGSQTAAMSSVVSDGAEPGGEVAAPLSLIRD